MKIIVGFSLFVLFILVVYPLIYLGTFSLSVEGKPSIDNYLEIFRHSTYFKALLNTAILGGIVTCIATFIGIFIGWAVSRTNMPMKSFIRNFSFFPFVIPSYVAAMAYVFLLGPRAGYLNRLAMWIFELDGPIFNIFSLFGLAFVMAFYCFPLVFLQITSALDSMDPALEEAAQSCGASKLQTVFKITVPIIRPAILSGAILVFVFAIALFGAPLIIAQSARIWVLTTRIFALFTPPPQYGLAAAISTLLIFLVAIALLLQSLALRSRRQFTTISGKAGAKEMLNLHSWRFVVLGFCLVVFLLSVVLPYLTMFCISLFKVHATGFSFGNITLSHYWEVLTSSFARRALRNSFILAIFTATLCSLFSIVLSFIEVRLQVKGKNILRALGTMPLSIPGTVLGVGVLLAWSRGLINLQGTLLIILIALMARCIPFGFQTLSASFRQLDPALEEAARISGATWGTTMWKIVIPLLKNGFLSAWILIFMVTMVELAAAIMLFGTGTEPVSVVMFDSFSEGSFQMVSALSIVVLIVCMIAYFCFKKIFGIGATHIQS